MFAHLYLGSDILLQVSYVLDIRSPTLDRQSLKIVSCIPNFSVHGGLYNSSTHGKAFTVCLTVKSTASTGNHFKFHLLSLFWLCSWLLYLFLSLTSSRFLLVPPRTKGIYKPPGNSHRSLGLASEIDDTPQGSNNIERPFLCSAVCFLME